MEHKAQSRWGCHLWRGWEQVLFPSSNLLSVCRYHENVHFLAQSLRQRSLLPSDYLPVLAFTACFLSQSHAFLEMGQKVHRLGLSRCGWQNQQCSDSSYHHYFSLAIRGVPLWILKGKTPTALNGIVAVLNVQMVKVILRLRVDELLDSVGLEV